MRLLSHLASHPGEVVSKEDINKAVWEGAHVTDDALTHSISQLRKVLEDCNEEPRFIRTIPKRGYQLVADVSKEAAIYAVRPLRLAILVTTNSLQGADQLSAAELLTYELMVRLTKRGLFRIVSRTSVRSYRSAAQPLSLITKELSADLILEGNLAQAGGKLRITMGLIDTNDEYLWAETYDISSEQKLIDQKFIAETIIKDLAKSYGKVLG